MGIVNQSAGFYVYRRLSGSFIADLPVRVHEAPKLWPCCGLSFRSFNHLARLVLYVLAYRKCLDSGQKGKRVNEIHLPIILLLDIPCRMSGLPEYDHQKFQLSSI